jgi:Cys-tRNA(Pro) deacylase
MEPLTPQDVQQALDELDLAIQVQELDSSTATAPEAAASIGTSLGSIVKSLVLMVNGEPIVVLTAGDRKVDTRKIAAMFEVGRKKVKIAKPEECIEHVGFAPGGVSPFGHRTTVPVYIDQSLARFETVYAAAGSPYAIFPIAYDVLVEKTGGQVVDIVVEEDGD